MPVFSKGRTQMVRIVADSDNGRETRKLRHEQARSAHPHGGKGEPPRREPVGPSSSTPAVG